MTSELDSEYLGDQIVIDDEWDDEDVADIELRGE